MHARFIAYEKRFNPEFVCSKLITRQAKSKQKAFSSNYTFFFSSDCHSQEYMELMSGFLLRVS